MQQLSNLEVYFLVKELNRRLAGARLANFYADRHFFRFKFNNGENLLVDLSKGVFLSNAFPEASGPNNLAMFFRSRLDNARFITAKQLNEDRIIALEFEKKEKHTVVVELFREGNVLLLNEKGVIEIVFKPAEYSSRALKKHEAYKTPPSAKKSVLALKESDLAGLKGPVVAVLSKIVNLSPFYIEESCARSGIAFDEESLSEKEAALLLANLRGLFNNLKPVAYVADGRIESYSVTPLKKMFLEVKEYASLSEALAAYYAQDFEEKKPDKTEYVEKQQQAALKEFEERSAEARQKADWIYANSTLIKRLLSAAVEGASERELNTLANGACKVEKKGKEIVLISG